jgi:hypothetical protein
VDWILRNKCVGAFVPMISRNQDASSTSMERLATTR